MFKSKKYFEQGRVHFVVASLLLLLSACNKHETKVTEEKLEANQDSIQRNFIDRSCVQCHQEATEKNRFVSLIDLSFVIEKSGGGPHGRFLIKPGCPKQSFLLTTMKQGQMPPPPAEPVSKETIQTIERYIIGLDPNAGPKCDDEPGRLEENF